MDAKQRAKLVVKCVLASAVTTIITVGVMGFVLSGGFGGGSNLRGTYSVIVHFEDLRGVPAGAPVRLAGVKIGEVVDVGVAWAAPPKFRNKLAYAELAIEGATPLYHGDTFEVGFGSLLGDRHIRIRRADPLGAMIPAESPPAEIAGVDAEQPSLLDEAILQKALEKWAQSAARK